jgi:hypothetical protein
MANRLSRATFDGNQRKGDAVTTYNLLISFDGREVDPAGQDLFGKEPLAIVHLNDGDTYHFHGEPGVVLGVSVVPATAVLNVYVDGGRQQPLVRAFGPASWTTFEPVPSAALPTGRFQQF